MTNTATGLIGGVDSHRETVHLAVITATGRPVDDREFPTTVAGYRRAVAWLLDHGTFQAVGVEGTSSYGVGIAHALVEAGFTVVEVNRTRPAERRKQGKTDQLDAYRAARSVLSEEATTDPKRASIEPLRALMVARRSAVKARQAAWRQIGSLLVNAPAHLRDQYRSLSRDDLVAVLAATRPGNRADLEVADILFGLRSLARHHQWLTEDIDSLEQRIHARVARANRALLAIKGVGPIVGAQLLITAGDNPDRLRSEPSFAALCGTAPIPVSSGRTDRHRLSRGGDRQANAALHTITRVRMSTDPNTRAYRDTHIAKGRTSKAIYRALKRAIAREIFKTLTQGRVVPDLADLRPTRQAKNITLTAAAKALGTYVNKIVRTELDTHPDYELAHRYRQWLQAA